MSYVIKATTPDPPKGWPKLDIDVDFSKADPDAHNFALKKLIEKFGPTGHCTLLDYVMFYGEGLKTSTTLKKD